jgi:hypothetical protein
MNVQQVYDRCFDAIGGETDTDVKWYLHERPKQISRQSFYDSALWAIWVSGMRRKSADTFLKRAAGKSRIWKFTAFAQMDNAAFSTFVRSLHGPRAARARLKWQAVRHTAIKLDGLDEQTFRRDFFAGKQESSSLGADDVCALARKKLPFIGFANSQFIIRNMGGEAVKCDRWVTKFLRYAGMSLADLEAKLKAATIPLGRFDVVLWKYCEQKVGRVSQFNAHFRTLLG